MAWTVILDPDFADWLKKQETGVRTAITAQANRLKVNGPMLGRPYVDTLKGSNLTNLKELRVQHKGEPWRVLFVFDSIRQAILLVGGNKKGNDRWYREAVPLAEERYKRHLEELENDDGN